MPETIAIDIDQTLYDFDSQVREAFFEMSLEQNNKELLRGAYSINMEWRNLTDVLGTDLALEAIQRVHDRTLYQRPFPGSEETVWRIKYAGHKIKYVTSRLEKYKDHTIRWLFTNGRFPYGDVICSTHDKTEHITDCRYLIDDRPRTIINFVTDHAWRTENDSQNDRKAFGLWTSYNRNLTDVQNVYLAPTWAGIAYYLERKEII